ncbi:MAG: fused MFS/spermidine synthase [Candidatus Obscuribacterales bacterium]|nr:fused MFS/spermidine synthase [Candidatus Obscuribacterales bacterium]
MSDSEEFSKTEKDDPVDDSIPAIIESFLGGKVAKKQQALTTIVGAAFFLSGFTALAYEIVWHRVLIRLVGASTEATSLIVCAYMTGLAIGGGLGLRFARSKKNMLQVLTLIEISIGVYAIISIGFCRTEFLNSLTGSLNATAGDIITLSGTGAIYAFGLVIFPTTLMGATLPVVAEFIARTANTQESSLGKLYAINTTGAVFGSLCAGLFLLPAYGVSATLLIASCGNALSAALLFISTSRSRRQTEPLGKEAPSANLDVYSTVAFSSGALSFFMEMIWTRYLLFLFGSSTFALSLVLSIFIGGLALGAWIATSMAKKVQHGLAAIPFILALTSMTLVLNLYQYQIAPEFHLTVKKTLFTVLEPGFAADSLSMIVSTSFLLLIPATLIGTTFPLMLLSGAKDVTTDDTRPQSSRISHHTAVLYSINLIGCVVGAFLGGLIALPNMSRIFSSGIESSTMLVAGIYGLASIGAFLTLLDRLDTLTASMRARHVALIMVISVVLIMLRPSWNINLMSSGVAYVSNHDLANLDPKTIVDILCLRSDASRQAGEQVLLYQEGANSSVSVVKNPGNNTLSLKNNGKVETSIPIESNLPSPTSDYPTQSLLGLLPTVLNFNDSLEGLVIGYGSGTTCASILRSSRVAKVTAIDIEEGVWTASRLFSRKDDRTDTPRIRKLTWDARNYLCRTSENYDFVISQAAEPWMSGASDLYTLEFYETAKSRLKTGGLFCQWLPLYSLTPQQFASLLRTFQQVFPDTTVWRPRRAGEVILTGRDRKSTDGLEGNTVRTMQILDETDRCMSSNDVNQAFQKIGIENAIDLYSNAIAYPEQLSRHLKSYPENYLNTDDNMIIEGQFAREMSSVETSIDATIGSVLGLEHFKPRWSDAPNRINPEDVLAFVRRQVSANHFLTDVYYLPVLEGNDTRGPSNWQTNLSANVLKRFGDPIDNLFAARLYLHCADLKKAKSYLSQVNPSSIDSYGEWCDVATIEMMSGSYASAKTSFEKAMNIRPGGARALSGIGLSHWLLLEWKKALPFLTQSLDLDPNQFLARYAVAQILTIQGDASTGLTQARAAGQLHPSSPIPGNLVTSYYISIGNLALADANLKLVLRRKSSLPDEFALGLVIASKTGSAALTERFRKRYQDLTKQDITLGIAESVATALLKTPRVFQPIR